MGIETMCTVVYIIFVFSVFLIATSFCAKGNKQGACGAICFYLLMLIISPILLSRMYKVKSSLAKITRTVNKIAGENSILQQCGSTNATPDPVYLK